MPTRVIQVHRFSIVSDRPVDEVDQSLSAALGQPDMNEFRTALAAVTTPVELEALIKRATGASGLMQFARVDAGSILRKGGVKDAARIVRLLVGNPLILKDLVRLVPDAASYAPVTLLIDERTDGVHISYDLMASVLSPYGSDQASAVASQLDEKIKVLIESAARV